jgi:hypothetical protein
VVSDVKASGHHTGALILMGKNLPLLRKIQGLRDTTYLFKAPAKARIHRVSQLAASKAYIVNQYLSLSMRVSFLRQYRQRPEITR